MNSIEPSNLPDDASPEAAAGTEEHKKRIPLIWIPATLSVGLLIAAVYLGGRIVKGSADAKPPVARAAAPAPPPPPLVQVTALPDPPSPAQKLGPEPLTAVTPDDGVPMIAPQKGERYIQVGALNEEATRRFIQRLRNEKMEPHVAPGPTPELMRVLIGPFDNRDALNEKKAQIETEGIKTFVRQY
jgi:cell division septation protein DedD